MDTRGDLQGTGTSRTNATGSPVSETGTEARQGRKGSPVLMVLVGGLLLAIVAWAAAEWWGESTDASAEQTATPPAGDNRPDNPNAAPGADPAVAPAPAPPASGSQGG